MENQISSINMRGGYMPYSIHANCFTVIHFYLLARRNIHNTNPSRRKSPRLKKKKSLSAQSLSRTEESMQ
jgi:hypothetical protein